MKKNYQFTFSDYNVDMLRLRYPPGSKALRKEYSRLRGVAVKRLERLAEAGYTQSAMFKYYNNYMVMPKLSDIPNEGYMIRSLSDIMRFLSKPTSTVSGTKLYRKEKIEQMRSHNYNVTEENFDSFISYMSGVREFNRSFGISESQGSPKEAEDFFTLWNEFYSSFSE